MNEKKEEEKKTRTGQTAFLYSLSLALSFSFSRQPISPIHNSRATETSQSHRYGVNCIGHHNYDFSWPSQRQQQQPQRAHFTLHDARCVMHTAMQFEIHTKNHKMSKYSPHTPHYILDRNRLARENKMFDRSREKKQYSETRSEQFSRFVSVAASNVIRAV